MLTQARQIARVFWTALGASVLGMIGLGTAAARLDEAERASGAARMAVIVVPDPDAPAGGVPRIEAARQALTPFGAARVLDGAAVAARLRPWLRDPPPGLPGIIETTLPPGSAEAAAARLVAVLPDATFAADDGADARAHRAALLAVAVGMASLTGVVLVVGAAARRVAAAGREEVVMAYRLGATAARARRGMGRIGATALAGGTLGAALAAPLLAAAAPDPAGAYGPAAIVSGVTVPALCGMTAWVAAGTVARSWLRRLP